MATYVMSDIHGEYNTLMEMLKQINFTKEDTLYILGDVVDRGKDGVKIVELVMNTPNINMILGNHEYMFIQYFKEDATEKTKRQWNRNGNYNTLYGFDELTDAEKKEMLTFLEELPDEYRLQVNGQKYILVHGFLGESTYRKVWNRPKIDEEVSLEENEKIIIGHTPVCEYVCPGTDEDMYVYSSKLTSNNDHFRILHAKNFTDIDCCIGYGFSAARLAALRLDDGKEFYQKIQI